ncbi:hypothetical protein [Pseudomonas sp. MWU12-2345]|uniref:hypothetical protein n=1 Tax=Pseudomonas sp. MWU12-2345 TaxID=2928689 RepID=UPI00200CD70A|nr:hypothetical protein [Pseudomonas sp. MWU12-2345]
MKKGLRAIRFIGGSMVLVLLMYVLFDRFGGYLSKAEAPAWVQAIGALFALVVAILVPRFQVKKALSEKRKAILAVAEAAYAHACNIRKVIAETDFSEGHVDPRIYDVYHKVIIDGIVKALQGVPMHELGSTNGVLAMLSLTDQMVFLGTAVEAILSGPTQHPELAKTLEAIEPAERKMYREQHTRCFEVLAQNVRTHLNRIYKDYELLVKSVKP